MSVKQKRATLGVVGLVFVATIVLGSSGVFSSAAPVGPPDQDVVDALLRVSLSPESLTAAGVADSDVEDVVSGVSGYLSSNPSVIESADARYFAAKTAADRLIRLVRSGLASSAEVSACREARAELESAETARANTLDAVFAAGVSSLTETQQGTLSRLRTNKASWNMPLELLVVDRTQAEWVRLRAALANERISAKHDEDPDATDQSHLATVRADASVSAASTHLATSLGDVTTAWERAVAE
ncbi:hypothetical protein KJ567_00140 [Candidatus Bipolaricaulota bacterium]|nr:hypothetical protein [Candidatus Bipolaricaulota bacterium]